MTDEEADALDKQLTETTPKLTTIPGVFARQRALLDALDALDALAANYILTRAEATHNTPAQIIGALVCKEVASA
jgi:hypothetical protein